MNAKKAKAIRKLAQKMFDEPDAVKQAHRLLKKDYLKKSKGERYGLV